MPELMLFGYPLSTLFLYFCFYSCAGWCMETIYCSIVEKRFVPRGFLHGPMCPIYGGSVLMMILFFTPLKSNLLVFYLASTVVMSAWEYFVGWLLEATTHVKYWDYSMFRFNLKGRICLWVCLVWGVLSYVCIFWIHPPVTLLVSRLSPLARQILSAVLAAVVLVDIIVTIRELTLMTKALNALQTLTGELQAQIALGRAGLSNRLTNAKDTVTVKFQDARDLVADAGSKLKNRYNDLVVSVVHTSRRLRNVYSTLRASKLDEPTQQDIQAHAGQLAQDRKEARAVKRAAKRKK